jgi:hypothetical protein
MIISKEPLTPESFLSAPRRGVIAPNRDGSLGLYSVSVHEFGVGTKKEWRVMDLSNGSSIQAIDDQQASDAVWDPLSDDVIIWLRTSEQGITEMHFTYLADRGSRVDHTCRGHTIESPVNGLRVKALDRLSMAVAVIGLTDSKGNLYNPDDPKNRQLSTARIYDDINVREVGNSPETAVAEGVC